MKYLMVVLLAVCLGLWTGIIPIPRAPEVTPKPVVESLSETDYATQADVSTYTSEPVDGRFEVVSEQNIDDGTNNGITIKVLVDKQTKVMYMQTEKYQAGYGVGLQVMYAADGKPLLYTEEARHFSGVRLHRLGKDAERSRKIPH